MALNTNTKTEEYMRGEGSGLWYNLHPHSKLVCVCRDIATVRG